MPTTQPLDPGDDAEGQLKPIANFAQNKPSPAAATPSPSVTDKGGTYDGVKDVKPATAQAPAAQQPGAATRRPGLRTSLKVRHLSLNGNFDKTAGADSATKADPGTRRTSPFDDNAVTQAWAEYAREHLAEHVLTNAMRGATPTRQGDTTTFAVTLVNTIQLDEVNKHMSEILAFMRQRLDNDTFDITVSVSDGPPSPETWNEYQVLTHMVEHHPAMTAFIADLDLKL